MAGVVARRVVTPILQPPPRRASSAGDSASSSASSSHPQPPFTLLSLSPTDITLTLTHKKSWHIFQLLTGWFPILAYDPKYRRNAVNSRNTNALFFLLLVIPWGSVKSNSAGCVLYGRHFMPSASWLHPGYLSPTHALQSLKTTIINKQMIGFFFFYWSLFSSFTFLCWSFHLAVSLICDSCYLHGKRL